ncbi:SRPBCC family protein [Pedobacter sp. Du54]|uniref:SRPBCC family protein n=1 Tax=Pedobacter anseongensis TaxID=3133439 RepID=UPI0030B7C854
MKILKVIGIIVLVLAIIIVVGGMFLPKTYTVSRTTAINASDSVVYKNIADFNEFYKWNPWARQEPTAKIKVSGPVAAPAHLYEWEGKETGQGYMKIKSVEPNKMVDIELKFLKPFESMADTRFDITPDGSGSKVTWTMSGENNLMSKWMGVFMSMDSMIGKDFENGLTYLKEKSEAGK